jgi:hypothetical protein
MTASSTSSPDPVLFRAALKMRTDRWNGWWNFAEVTERWKRERDRREGDDREPDADPSIHCES